MSRLLCVALLLLVVSTAMAYPTDLLPPPEGTYASTGFVIYPYGFVLRNFTMSGFTGSIAPPALLATTNHSFGSILDMDFSNDQGFTWTHETMSGSGWIRTNHDQDIGQTAHFAEEITSLGGVNGARTLRLRESPIQHSSGVTTITEVQSGDYQIDSFFDVWVEISIDDGNTWIAPTQAAHEVMPEPSSLISLLGGLGAVGGLLLKKRR